MWAVIRSTSWNKRSNVDRGVFTIYFLVLVMSSLGNRSFQDQCQVSLSAKHTVHWITWSYFTTRFPILLLKMSVRQI